MERGEHFTRKCLLSYGDERIGFWLLVTHGDNGHTFLQFVISIYVQCVGILVGEC